MNIRKLKHEDWRKLKTLLVNSCQESPDAFSASEDENSPDFLFQGRAKKYSRENDYITFILENDKGEWGIILGTSSNIGHFWVDPKVRGDGYGKKLFRKFLGRSQAQGSSCIELYAIFSEFLVFLRRFLSTRLIL